MAIHQPLPCCITASLYLKVYIFTACVILSLQFTKWYLGSVSVHFDDKGEISDMETFITK